MEDNISYYCGCPTGRVCLTSTKPHHYLLLATGPRTSARLWILLLVGKADWQCQGPAFCPPGTEITSMCVQFFQPSPSPLWQPLPATTLAFYPLLGPTMASLTAWRLSVLYAGILQPSRRQGPMKIVTLYSLLFPTQKWSRCFSVSVPKELATHLTLRPAP